MFCRRLLCGLTAPFLAILIFLPIAQAHAEPTITLKIDSVYVCNSPKISHIPVRLKSVRDTIADFSIWIMLNRPDLVQFGENPDDPNSMIDTAGTLLSGWIVEARCLGGFGHDIKIDATAPPGVIGILPSLSDSMPLVNLKVKVMTFPDTLTDRIAVLYLMGPEFLDYNGDTLGVQRVQIINTRCWRCLNWYVSGDDSTCLEYAQVALPPCDSTSVDTSYATVLDTTVVRILNGTADVYDAGDVNGDHKVDIKDVTRIIILLYREGERPVPFEVADVNGDWVVNIRDITYLIQFLYKNGPAPICH